MYRAILSIVKTYENFNFHFDRCFKILCEPSFKFILKWIDPRGTKSRTLNESQHILHKYPQARFSLNIFFLSYRNLYFLKYFPVFFFFFLHLFLHLHPGLILLYECLNACITYSLNDTTFYFLLFSLSPGKHVCIIFCFSSFLKVILEISFFCDPKCQLESILCFLLTALYFYLQEFSLENIHF